MSVDKTLVVGTTEKQDIEISRNWLWGAIVVRVNGEKVKTKLAFFGGHKKVELSLGQNEKHKVIIIVKIPLLFGAYKDWKYEVYVDGNLTED
jgi:hypothetical protein